MLRLLCVAALICLLAGCAGSHQNTAIDEAYRQAAARRDATAGTRAADTTAAGAGAPVSMGKPAFLCIDEARASARETVDTSDAFSLSLVSSVFLGPLAMLAVWSEVDYKETPLELIPFEESNECWYSFDRSFVHEGRHQMKSAALKGGAIGSVMWLIIFVGVYAN